MESKYPHWYGNDSKIMSSCDYPERDMMCCSDQHEFTPQRMYYDSFKDRLMSFLGDEVLIATEASLRCRNASFCGTVCYVGCDYVIINSRYRRKNISLHVPLKMIRFIAPFKSRR
ncbi:MAG: hypothetical protein LBR56_02385 [Sporomusaceae bacterium]|nr:hypothetical protein [Sporomusaceae bacterium]